MKKRRIARILTMLIVSFMMALSIVACGKSTGNEFKLTEFPAPEQVTAGYQSMFTIPTVTAKGNDDKEYKAEPTVMLGENPVQVFGGQFAVSEWSEDYKIIWTVAANDKEFTKETKVVVQDVAKPEITIYEFKKIYGIGEGIELPQVEVTDDIDENVSWKAEICLDGEVEWTEVENGFELTESGNYRLRISATDKANNTGEAFSSFVVRVAKAKGEIEFFSDEHVLGFADSASPLGIPTSLVIDEVGGVAPDNYYGKIVSGTTAEVNPKIVSRTTKEELQTLIAEGYNAVAIRMYVDAAAPINLRLCAKRSGTNVLSSINGIPNNQWVTVVFKDKFTDYVLDGTNILTAFLEHDWANDNFLYIPNGSNTTIYFDRIRFAKAKSVTLSKSPSKAFGVGDTLRADDFTVEGLDDGEDYRLTVSHDGNTVELDDTGIVMSVTGEYTVRAELSGEYACNYDVSVRIIARTKEKGEIECFNDENVMGFVAGQYSTSYTVNKAVGGALPKDGNGYYGEVYNDTAVDFQPKITPRTSGEELAGLIAEGYNAVAMRVYVESASDSVGFRLYCGGTLSSINNIPTKQWVTVVFKDRFEGTGNILEVLANKDWESEHFLYTSTKDTAIYFDYIKYVKSADASVSLKSNAPLNVGETIHASDFNVTVANGVDYRLTVSYDGDTIVIPQDGFEIEAMGNYIVRVELSGEYACNYTASVTVQARAPKEKGEIECFNDSLATGFIDKSNVAKCTTSIVADTVGGAAPKGYYGKISAAGVDINTKINSRTTKEELQTLIAEGYNAVEIRMYVESASAIGLRLCSKKIGNTNIFSSINNIPAKQWVTVVFKDKYADYALDGTNILTALLEHDWANDNFFYSYNTSNITIYLDYIRYVKYADASVSLKSGVTFNVGDTISATDFDISVPAGVEYRLTVSNNDNTTVVPQNGFEIEAYGNYIVRVELSGEYACNYTASATVQARAQKEKGEIECFNDPFATGFVDKSNTSKCPTSIVNETVGGESPKGGKGYYGKIGLTSSTEINMKFNSRTTNEELQTLIDEGYNAIEIRMYVDATSNPGLRLCSKKIGNTNIFSSINGIPAKQWVTVVFKDKFNDYALDGTNILTALLEHDWANDNFFYSYISNVTIYLDYIKCVKYDGNHGVKA